MFMRGLCIPTTEWVTPALPPSVYVYRYWYPALPPSVEWVKREAGREEKSLDGQNYGNTELSLYIRSVFLLSYYVNIQHHYQLPAFQGHCHCWVLGLTFPYQVKHWVIISFLKMREPWIKAIFLFCVFWISLLLIKHLIISWNITSLIH